jgi:hypothetical protein
MASGLDSTKTPARPSHEAIESTGGNATDADSARKRLDEEAMQSAKRAQNRIHNEEEKNPEDTIFTK